MSFTQPQNDIPFLNDLVSYVDGIVIIQTKLIDRLTICQINMGQKSKSIKNCFIN